jgi:hypothetical protein
MTIEVMTSKKCLLENVSPTGTKYVIEFWPANNALYRIRSVNKNGPEIAELAGTFTSSTRAQMVLTKYLVEQWAMSDAVTARNKSKQNG